MRNESKNSILTVQIGWPSDRELTNVNSESTDEKYTFWDFLKLHISVSVYPLVPILRSLHFDNSTMWYWRNSEMVFAFFYNGYWMDCCHLIWNDLVCWNYGRSFAYQSFYNGISHYCCWYVHSRKGIIPDMNATRKWVQVKIMQLHSSPKRCNFIGFGCKRRFWWYGSQVI